jgi:3-oxoacyl-[acyl-carrier protein] reductase
VDFNNKIVFITGTNRGIGFSILSLFVKHGAVVIAHARNYSEEFEFNLQEISLKYSATILPVYFELSDIPSQLELKKILGDFKHIDILVNNAGVIHGNLLQMTQDSDIERIFNINLFSIIRLTQRLIPFLRRSISPNVINLSSINSYDLEIGNTLYGVSKAAVNALTKTLYKELAPLNIRVNAVAPGLVDTDMARSIEPKAYQKALDRTLLHKPISPDDIAKVVLFLASEDSKIINGEIIRCDGGRI